MAFAAAPFILPDRLSLTGVTQAKIAICSLVLKMLPVVYAHMYKHMYVHLHTCRHTFIDIHFCLVILVCLFLLSDKTLPLSILKVLVNLMTKINSDTKNPNNFCYWLRLVLKCNFAFQDSLYIIFKQHTQQRHS